LLRTLSAEAEDVETPLQSAIAAPVVSQSSSGPGEFTRIISGSMLREAQGRTGIPQSVNGDAWQQQQTPMAASGSTPMPMPNLTPGMSPVMPAASPVMPMTPQMVSPQPPRMPMTPPVPSAPAPSLHVQPEAPADGKLQQYMPLLLIANFFLMLLVLILVVFVLLHHH
jgi:hypothetical protein